MAKYMEEHTTYYCLNCDNTDVEEMSSDEYFKCNYCYEYICLVCNDEEGAEIRHNGESYCDECIDKQKEKEQFSNIVNKWQCANYDGDDLVHSGPPCDCTDGCGGSLCLCCCEEEMFGTEED